jgi:hypothetical protein
MLLDEGTTVVHIGLNPLGLKHEHLGNRLGQECDETPFNDL